MRMVGVMGGTFNPIHYGHLRMAQELADALQFEQIRFIPAANPPHKALPLISAEHRAAMVRLAIANNPLFMMDDRELIRQGASYTIDTLKSLRDELGPQVSLTLLMGSDAFASFDTWHHWQEILHYAHIAVVQRPQLLGLNIKPSQAVDSFLRAHSALNQAELRQHAAGRIIQQKITALDISSTAIRNTLNQHYSVRYLIPDCVIDYINQHQLYQ